MGWMAIYVRTYIKMFGALLTSQFSLFTPVRLFHLFTDIKVRAVSVLCCIVLHGCLNRTSMVQYGTTRHAFTLD